MSRRITITAFGHPRPQGSKRLVGGRMIESSKGLPTWREDVKLAALRALEEHPSWDRSAAAVSLHVVFTLPRPKSHFRTGKFAHLLRDDASPFVSTTPDLSKLIRSTEDALTTAGVFADDCRVVSMYAVKCYPDVTGRHPGALGQPGARVVVTEV